MNRLDRDMLKIMPDGTEKHINPFTGTEVWFIPGRKNRPVTSKQVNNPVNIEKRTPEDYCNFCPGQYFNTTPEKSRLVNHNGKFEILDQITAEEIFNNYAEFRRISNLFEIVTVDYWKKNFSYRLSEKNKKRKEKYLASELGRNHVISVINMKLKYSGLTEDEIKAVSVDEKLAMSDAFFGGAHELVIPKRHYTDTAVNDSDLASSGTLTPEEHFLYFHFNIQAMKDIYENNRYVRYVSIFQNWLREAGASFNHLHKQLVGLDEWGVSVERELDLASRNPNIYNEYAANFAAYNNFVICENDYAVAFADIGHRNPTVAIYSKSVHCNPAEHTEEEVRGFSDIIHGIHAAMGSQISCNEEWYYMPVDSVIPMPWHVLIKWRISIQAGFEGGTKIYVNPMAVSEVRDYLVPRLFDLRYQGKIATFQIAEECPVKPNSLKYYKNILS
ncbi:DUF4921 family protein [candidate division KSB1 bacterium]|nr:DUF4921 family protein [candidate division KSB1 bacterium]